MSDLQKLADVVSLYLGNLAVKPRRCSRVRSHLSTCRACLEVCPTNGIKLSETGLEVENCIDCGLCTSACVTGALVWTNPSPLQLIEKVTQKIQEFEEAVIYCGPCSPKKKLKQGIEVPCLGSIPWECWLQLLLLSDQVKVLLPGDPCPTCRVKGGGESWRRQLGEAERITGKRITFVANAKTRRRRPSGGSVDTERRRFLRSVVDGLGKVPEIVIPGFLGGDEGNKITADRVTISERRQVLLNLIREYPPFRERILIKLPVMVGNCQFCRACSILCPQGALKQNKTGDVVKLELNVSACSGCNLCATVCFHKALELKSFRAMKLGEGIICVTEGQDFSCPECGELYTAVRGGKCFRCRNKMRYAFGR
ncbi:hypothetical protein [Calderihabitans maritimus]|uniref:4Fe-4S ferredoxin-type domain-containing protein n=1 Tax=Calderihabitans maritimus TaxID=1246530 RepID=A0A1Z5HP06_9FIRM|nr:hypothetical protein [Calderihabitans maritimus]GAW91253.1 hypothetical protein KKC1_04150 [Calderihabitans maritimus]